MLRAGAGRASEVLGHTAGLEGRRCLSPSARAVDSELDFHLTVNPESKNQVACSSSFHGVQPRVPWG